MEKISRLRVERLLPLPMAGKFLAVELFTATKDCLKGKTNVGRHKKGDALAPNPL